MEDYKQLHHWLRIACVPPSVTHPDDTYQWTFVDAHPPLLRQPNLDRMDTTVRRYIKRKWLDGADMSGGFTFGFSLTRDGWADQFGSVWRFDERGRLLITEPES